MKNPGLFLAWNLARPVKSGRDGWPCRPPSMRCATLRRTAGPAVPTTFLRNHAFLRLPLFCALLLACAGWARAVPGVPQAGVPPAPQAAAEPWTEERCLETALRLGDPSTRQEALAEIAASPEFPAALWVRLLTHPSLEVRLGALEVLEDRAGSDLGYDPWEPDPNRRHTASQDWEEWLASGGVSAAPFRLDAPFREESMRVWLADLLSGDAARTERALSRMQPHHREAIAAIEAHYAELGEAAPGLRARLKEAQCRLLLDDASLREGRRIARLLATGNRDEKVEALDLLEGAPAAVLPLVGEGLRDPDPLVRERAMDLLLSIGGASAVPLARDHLARDDDPNVLHAALRGLGKIQGAESVRTLSPYLAGEDEDLAAAALQSLSLLGDAARAASASVTPCLEHPSWRVRAAALQYFSKTRAAVDEKLLIRRLDDEDSFVRSTAVASLAAGKGGSGGLSNTVESAFVTAAAKHPDLLGPVLRGFKAANHAIPAAIVDTLKKAPPETLHLAIPSLNPGSDGERRLLETAATGPDPDLAAAALGTLATSPEASGTVRRLLIDALLGDSGEDREIVLSRLKLNDRPKATSRQAWQSAVDALSPGADGGKPEAPPATPPAPAAKDGIAELLDAFGAGDSPPALEPAPPTGAPEATAGSAPDSPTPVDALLDAFGLGEAPAPVTPAPPAPTDPIDDLTAAFLGDEAPKADPAPVQGSQGGAEAATVPDALDRLAASAPFGDDRPGRTAFRAAQLLLESGDPLPVGKLVESLAALSVQDRAELAATLDRCPHPGFLPLWRALLADEAAAVRRAAFRSALDEEYPVLVQFVLREALAPGHPADPADLYSSTLEYLAGNRQVQKTIAGIARDLVDRKDEEKQRIFGLILLRASQSDSDKALLESCLADPSHWVRRAAAYALGNGSAAPLATHLASLAGDPSAWVREAAAAAAGRSLPLWKHGFSETEEVDHARSPSSTDYGFAGGSRSLFSSTSKGGPGRSLPPETAGLLRRLTGDVSERVRLAAWASLLANGEAIDAEAVSELIARSPDRERWGSRLADWVSDGAAHLDEAQRESALAIALRALDPKSLASIQSKLGGTGNTPLHLDFAALAVPSADAPSRAPAPAPADDTPDAAASSTTAPPATEAVSGDHVRVLFFHNPGCHECDQVREDLAAMRRTHPTLIIDEHNIRDTEAVLLNEALCDRFQIDPQLRLATPAVFLQEGALVKSEITRPALDELIRRTLEIGETDLWHGLAEAERAASKLEVESRFAALGLLGVFLAGLLDGINPCAFATIIFLLSYLQVARRSPREILAVGGAFILAVFLTYFLLGLGLVEVVGRLQSLRVAGRILNLALAAACLYVAWASFRDARLARQGRLAEMTLQLPGFLKDRIRSVVRTGARSRRFVASAFLCGVVISVLELACTGQVYLPTIVYAMKAGLGGAVWFLLLYNLAFVIPLVVVFVLAWRGMGSESLIRFQQRRTALVKTAMGWLFLVLFVALLLSGRL